MIESDFCDPHLLMDGSSPDSPEWALADSFDAVTTGMENPEAFARLMASGRYDPWKALILAIDALYRCNPEACQRAIPAFSASPVLSPLVPLFRAWLCEVDSPSLVASDREHRRFLELSSSPAPVVALHGKLFVEHPLGSLAEQAEEALRQGMPDHFEALAYRILRELRSLKGADGPLLSMRYVATCLEFLSGAGGEGLDFYGLVIRALGRADGFLSLALSLLEKDENAAILAFRAVLEADESGAFFTEELRPAVEDFLAVLERKDPAAAPEIHAVKTVQLELF